MSDANLERITILLQAKDRDFARAMDRNNKLIARLNQDGGRNMTQMTRTVNSRLDEMAASALSFGRAFVGGLAFGAVSAGLGMLTTGLRQTVRGIAQVGDEARRAGVGVEAFQEWGFVAQQNRIGIDQLVDGFKELNLRADEFVVTGAGPAAEAFTRLGFSSEDLARRLEDPSELMLEIIRRMEGLDRAAQIRVADEVFGGSAGERFVELLAQGEQGLRNTMQRARQVGAVMDSEMIQRAAILDTKFQELTTRVQRFFQAAAVGLFAGGVETPADTLERLFGTLERAQSALGDDMFSALIAQAGELTDAAERAASAVAETVDPEQLSQSARWLTDEIASMTQALAESGQTGAAESMRELHSIVSDLAAGFLDGSVGAEELTEGMTETATEAKSVVEALGEVDAARFGGVIGAINGLIERLAAARQAGDAARASLPGQAGMTTGTPLANAVLPQDMLGGRRSQAPRRAPALLGEPEVPSGSGTGVGSGSSRYGAAVEDITASVRALELEAAALVAAAGSGREYGDAIEYARLRAQLMNDALADGREITPQLQAEIDALAESYLTAGRSVDQAREAMDRVREDAKRGADAFLSIFEAIGQGSDAARAAVARLLAQMASAQFARFLDGLGATGGGGGVLGAIGRLLGRAGGGGVQAGTPYLVNENTPNSEVFVPSRSGGILNVAQAKSALAGQSGGPMAITVNVTGASGDDHVIALVHQGVRQGLAAYDRALPGRVRGLNPRRA